MVVNGAAKPPAKPLKKPQKNLSQTLPQDPTLKHLIENLMFTGLTESEAKAYLSLLRSSPATAYEVSRASGVPTSKVYEVMARLEERGAVAAVESRGKRKYHPQGPADFIRLRRHMMEATLGVLAEGLAGHSAVTPALTLLEGYDDVIERARVMIESASRTLLLSIADEESILLVEAIEAAASARKVAVAILRMGEPGAHVELSGAVYEHPLAHTIQHARGIRTLTVVADSTEALSATITEGPQWEGPDAEAAVGRNAGFVFMAEDYIRHDIYMMKLVRRLAPVIKESFGAHFEELRDVFSG